MAEAKEPAKTSAPVVTEAVQMEMPMEVVVTPTEEVAKEKKAPRTPKATKEKVATTKKTPAKTVVKKPAAKKPTVATSAAEGTEVVTRGRKAKVKETVYLEFSGKSYTQDDLIQIAQDVWQFDLKQPLKEFKDVELYVKPEENMVYYVINGTEMGSFYI